VQECRGCPLWRGTSQAVFGEGPLKAGIVLVGEQPGDREDREGRPFVGPAGRELDRVLELAGIDRDATYVTNVVKHFKFRERGKRRIHDKPTHAEAMACLPWLERELALLKPNALVALGATAGPARHRWISGGGRLMSDRVKAMMHRRMAEPGSAKR